MRNHHFFSKGSDGTTRATTLTLMIAALISSGKEFDIYLVPLPFFGEKYEAPNGVPEVDGTVFVGHWGRKA